jgi:ABC-type amino acid transport substrate-binding protein
LKQIILLLTCCFVLAASIAKAETGTLAKIMETGQITLGYRGNTPPFSYLTQDDVVEGFSIDLCRVIARSVQERLKLEKLEIRYVPVTSENRLDAVADGRVDIECGATTRTLSRQKQVEFTHLTFVTGGTLLTTTDSGVESLFDLQDKSVAVTSGTTTQAALRQYLSNEMISATVLEVPTHSEGMRLLNDGKVAAYAADQVVLAAQALRETEGERYAMIEGTFSYEPYALVVRRDDADFLLAANTALSRLFSSGDIMKLYQRWFSELSPTPHPVLVALYKLQAIPE